jgi:thiol:disulfide interchange protein DsbD
VHPNAVRRLTLPLLLVLASPALALPVQQPHSEAELIAEHAAVAGGQTLAVALRLRMEPDWHVYWKNPGDSGMATSIAWLLPPGFTAGDMQWPAPSRIDTGPLTSYGYQGEVYHLVDIAVPAGVRPGRQVALRAKVDWLVCKEICLPASADLALELPVVATPQAAAPERAAVFAAARATLPVPAAGSDLAAYRDGDELIVRIPAQAGTPPLREVAFFPAREGLIENSAKQVLTRSAGGYDLRLRATGANRTLAGVLVPEPGLRAAAAMEFELPIQAGPAPAQPASTANLALAGALALAFGGGLLLNLMPCVFPVLAIKVLSMVQQTHGRSRDLRTHGLLFAAGAVTSFWLIAGVLLALRAKGEALGWGYQLQSPPIVAALGLLFFVLALNLSGVFRLGTRVQALAGSVRARNVHVDAVLSGALAAAVASPCTAPFMGAALGFALVQPAPDAMLVFTALAIGMALPYVVLCFAPQLTRRLPRPGPWMDSLRQALAFPLYATVVWLLWVLGRQAGIDAVARLLLALVLVAAALWALGRWAQATGRTRIVARVGAAALVAGALVAAWRGAPAPDVARVAAADRWTPWSDEAVRAALAQGRPAFVDFTAAWCLTCQVNKQLVLNADTVVRRFDELQVVRLRADWTRRDPTITAALTRLRRSGVPVYALYLPARRDPQLLPEILTRRLVLDTLEGAAQVIATSSVSTAPASTAPASTEQEQP